MARLTSIYTVEDNTRDQGRRYLITEMPASKAEKWAERALLALMSSGVQIPENVATAGLAGIAELGLKAFMGIKWEDLEPLLDEMFECVQFMPDISKPDLLINLHETHIEEIVTRIKLRAAIWDLHTGFLKAAVPSDSAESHTVASNQSKPNIKTSRQ